MLRQEKREDVIKRLGERPLFIAVLIFTIIMIVIIAKSTNFSTFVRDLFGFEVAALSHEVEDEETVSDDIYRAEDVPEKNRPKVAISIQAQETDGITRAKGRSRHFDHDQKEIEMMLEEQRQVEADFFAPESDGDFLGLTEAQFAELDEETILILQNEEAMLDDVVAKHVEDEINHKRQTAEEILAEEAHLAEQEALIAEEEADLVVADLDMPGRNEGFLGLTEAQFAELDEETIMILQNEEGQLLDETQ